MSAFYTSTASASEYLYGLGVNLADYLFLESDGGSSAKFFAWLPEDIAEQEEDIQEEMLFKASPYESTHPWISDVRKCPAEMTHDPESWLIYIPFDTCQYRLGGSLLAEANGHNGGIAPTISDPDYFIDCYEVVRELTEDGILMAGMTVADGGLATAVEKMRSGAGVDIDISGLTASYQDQDIIRVLFGEVPGVLIQVSDENYDYVDSQFLLQDVAYYPVGHPSGSHCEIRLAGRNRNGVAEILASLMSQATEGED